MSLRPGWLPPKVHLTVISGYGGLGDSIARLPAFRYCLDTYEHVSLTVYALDGFKELMEFLMPETPRLRWKKYSELPFKPQKPYVEFDNNRLTTLHKHLTEHAFDILMDMSPPSREAMAYPHAPRVELAPADPVLTSLLARHDPRMVIFTTDYTAPARAWPSYHINQLAVKVREAGLTPVLLGKSEPIPTGVEDDHIRPKRADGIKPELFIDLRDKTTLVEALGVIQRAKAVVGVDNGLLHLAHCTGVPVVMGFTTLKPEHRVPVREAELTKVLESQVPCAGCQSRGFAINTDWRECVMPERKYVCLLTLTADRFWDKLKELNVV